MLQGTVLYTPSGENKIIEPNQTVDLRKLKFCIRELSKNVSVHSFLLFAAEVRQ